MTITYPLAMPTSPGFSSVRISTVNVVSQSVSLFTLQTQVQKFPGQAWQITATLPKMTREEAEEWNAFFISLKGIFGTFYAGDPAGRAPRGAVTGNGTFLSSAGSSSRINTRAWPAFTDIFKAGDYIQIGLGLNSRLYKILENTRSLYNGSAVLEIFPDLKLSTPAGATVYSQDSVGLFRLTSNEFGFDIDTARHYGLTFSARSVV